MPGKEVISHPRNALFGCVCKNLQQNSCYEEIYCCGAQLAEEGRRYKKPFSCPTAD